MNAKVQSVRKINAAFGLETALQVFQDEISNFDPAATDVEVSLSGREPGRREILIAPGNQARKIQATKFRIPRFQSAIALDGTPQIVAAYAVSRERKRGGRRSCEMVIE